jgi:hypothetical protein
MTEELINWKGETIALSKIVAHFRLMQRAARTPRDRQTYVWLLRMLIINARAQRAERAAERIAA